MPLIDFKCNDCEKEFFEIVKNSNEEVKCPECNSVNVKRLYKGKFYGKCEGKCNGNCGGCSGCH
ncbi:FmdB family zinc ribbon protein [Hathewaya limosa]|uniref:FmdB family regulatory protein n=1 Tax=Hathewaya limosa TaxID=1536 RepID=A0ABU0JNM3_HATLI|nr:FmdB family zinc ribbon protein [Hathewaya limosa]AWZ49697.1 zinc ribbon domain-containing protein [Clostridiaceae bacterium 14S0207]MDQ0478684.1 putative FmdB family regulatory protein [Hathewaya limosa]